MQCVKEVRINRNHLLTWHGMTVFQIYHHDQLLPPGFLSKKVVYSSLRIA